MREREGGGEGEREIKETYREVGWNERDSHYMPHKLLLQYNVTDLTITFHSFRACTIRDTRCMRACVRARYVTQDEHPYMTDVGIYKHNNSPVHYTLLQLHIV